MTHVNVFTVGAQPYAEYYVPIDLPDGKQARLRFTNDPRKVAHCHECGRKRWVKNLAIQVYYDMSIIACCEGHDWDGRRRRWVTRTPQDKKGG